jgi:hypothetical protein
MICIICIGYVKSNQTCPPPVIDFRYLDKTFEEQQSLPVPLSSIYSNMFEGKDAWIQTNNNARPGLT